MAIYFYLLFLHIAIIILIDLFFYLLFICYKMISGSFELYLKLSNGSSINTCVFKSDRVYSS